MEKELRAVLTVAPLNYPDEVQIEYRQVVDDRITNVGGKFDPESWSSARQRLIATEQDLDAAQVILILGNEADLGVRQIRVDDAEHQVASLRLQRLRGGREVSLSYGHCLCCYAERLLSASGYSQHSGTSSPPASICYVSSTVRCVSRRHCSRQCMAA